MTTTFDDATWHSSEDGYPTDLGPEAAATHVGVFLAWAVLSGHASASLERDAADGVAALRERATTGGRFVLDACDGRLDADALDDDAAAFAAAYYTGGDDEDEEAGLYLEDYVDAVSPGEGDPTDVYRVPDTWDTYELVGPLVDSRFAQWQDEGRPAVLRHRA
ncbi:hypothetical protein [Cellulosimicrobium sp. NPDC057127]|uniref:DUF7832 domain-containing protein n=1 Tax=Cellulosimicrobium sp. NPDC057127 TaxID=3346026 RepID=UPI0036308EB3